MQHGTDIQTTVTSTAANNQPCFEPRPEPRRQCSANKRKEGNVPNSKLPCESKLELLREYMATVETLKVARQEITKLLTTTGSAVALSKQRIKKIKVACTAARLRFTEHRNAHRC
jgi:hypothetical protein